MSSHHVSEEYGCLKHPHWPVIDGDMSLNSGWFWGGLGVVVHVTRGALW